MQPSVDLVVAVKTLDRAKSRLLGAADGGIGAREAHERLALAIAADTVEVANAVARRVLVVSSDAEVGLAMSALGVKVIADPGTGGLNAALAHGFGQLRADDSRSVIGALQSDLPALRPRELDGAIRSAAGVRSFCADRHGTGTTLLLTAPGGPLAPLFGTGSAAAHAASGAVALEDALPSLRCDVDTVADLKIAGTLGLGQRTRAATGR